MGRTRQPLQPLPVEIVTEAFAIRQEDGQLVRRGCHVAALAHGPATFTLNGKLMCRVYYEGSIRRILATRIAWALACGRWPDGPVKCRNGNEHDLRAENLIQVERGPRPFVQGRGGKASALAERQARNTMLLRTLAENPDATVPQLSRLIGASESCTCVRLAKLETQGLTCSPKCQAHIRWRLSQAGSEFAATGRPGDR